MGLLFSRRRKQRTSKEILEELEKDIGALGVRKKRSQQYEKSFIGYLLILSFLTYLVGAFIFYLYFLPKTWLEGAINSLPLLLFPLVVYLVKKLLNMYFTNKKAQIDLQLKTLQEEKRKVLNEVMERETYNTVRELLQRFDPQHPSLQAAASRNQEGRRGHREGTSDVRQRRQPTQPPHPALQHRPVAMATPQPVRNPPVVMATPQQVRNAPVVMATPDQSGSATAAQPPPPVDTTNQFIPPGMCLGTAPGPPAPSPILPRNRSSMDKVVEYLVSDGPNNRYALVCSQCHSHNGMALRDEFEYLTFRCAYCYHLNPARKRKPSLRPPQNSQNDATAATVPTSETQASPPETVQSQPLTSDGSAAGTPEDSGTTHHRRRRRTNSNDNN